MIELAVRVCLSNLISWLNRVMVSQIFAFFIGFLFQSMQLTFVVVGFGGVAVLAVRGLMLS